MNWWPFTTKRVTQQLADLDRRLHAVEEVHAEEARKERDDIQRRLRHLEIEVDVAARRHLANLKMRPE